MHMHMYIRAYIHVDIHNNILFIVLLGEYSQHQTFTSVAHWQSPEVYDS